MSVENDIHAGRQLRRSGIPVSVIGFGPESEDSGQRLRITTQDYDSGQLLRQSFCIIGEKTSYETNYAHMDPGNGNVGEFKFLRGDWRNL